LIFHPQVIRSDMEPTVTRAEKSRHEHKTLIFFLVALELLAAVILIVGSRSTTIRLGWLRTRWGCRLLSRCSAISVST
jgi:hypothetical protein